MLSSNYLSDYGVNASRAIKNCVEKMKKMFERILDIRIPISCIPKEIFDLIREEINHDTQKANEVKII